MNRLVVRHVEGEEALVRVVREPHRGRFTPFDAQEESIERSHSRLRLAPSAEDSRAQIRGPARDVEAVLREAGEDPALEPPGGAARECRLAIAGRDAHRLSEEVLVQIEAAAGQSA